MMMTNLLLVDDSITIRRVMKNVLSRMIDGDVAMHEAGNGIEAMNVVKKQNGNIDLILLDVNMPEMPGDVFLENLRKEAAYKGIRVVMVTTEAEKKTVIKIMKLGANGYIVKPFTPEVVRRSLRPILDRMRIPMTAA